MKIEDETKKSLILSGNASITDELYKKLVENCFAALLKDPEVHSKYYRTDSNTSAVLIVILISDINDLLASKPDVIKEVYAALLTVAPEFGRNDYTKDAVTQYLINECKYDKNRAEVFADFYDSNKLKLQVELGNIGPHFPHIVDASWKIDYVVKVQTIFINFIKRNPSFL